MHHLLLSLLFAVLSLPAVAGEGPAIFQPGSYQQILAARQGQPFIMVFWSLECSHCMGELKLLGELLDERPQLPLVLVSTDSPRETDELQRVAAHHDLGTVEQWVFAEADSPRLRFAVDRQWYGELPRSYLFDAGHQRRSHSGALKREALEAWITNNLKGDTGAK